MLNKCWLVGWLIGWLNEWMDGWEKKIVGKRMKEQIAGE